MRSIIRDFELITEKKNQQMRFEGQMHEDQLFYERRHAHVENKHLWRFRIEFNQKCIVRLKTRKNRAKGSLCSAWNRSEPNIRVGQFYRMILLDYYIVGRCAMEADRYAD